MGCESRMFTDIFLRMGKSSSDCTDCFGASGGSAWSGRLNFSQPEEPLLPVLVDFATVQPDVPFLLVPFAFAIEKVLSRVVFCMVCIVHRIKKIYTKAALAWLT